MKFIVYRQKVKKCLFTFIDKGVYRPLGESGQTYEASVQIIGATTESSENFLTTFNRRIPMSITLPSLDAATLDERMPSFRYLFSKRQHVLANKLISNAKQFWRSCYTMQKEILVS